MKETVDIWLFKTSMNGDRKIMQQIGKMLQSLRLVNTFEIFRVINNLGAYFLLLCNLLTQLPKFLVQSKHEKTLTKTRCNT